MTIFREKLLKKIEMLGALIFTIYFTADQTSWTFLWSRSVFPDLFLSLYINIGMLIAEIKLCSNSKWEENFTYREIYQ